MQYHYCSKEVRLLTDLDNRIEDISVTDTELARICGVDRTTIWRWRYGKAQPTDARALLKLSKYLGVSLSELVSGKIELPPTGAKPHK